MSVFVQLYCTFTRGQVRYRDVPGIRFKKCTVVIQIRRSRTQWRIKACMVTESIKGPLLSKTLVYKYWALKHRIVWKLDKSLGLNLQFTVCVLYSVTLKTSLLCVRAVCSLFAIKHNGNHLYIFFVLCIGHVLSRYSSQRPPVQIDRFFPVPWVVVLGRFDCTMSVA